MSETTSAQVIVALQAYDKAMLGRPIMSFPARVRAMKEALDAAAQYEAEERRRRVDRAAADIIRMASVPQVNTRTSGGIVSRCYAQQCGDEMLCGRCGLTWDTNDPEPPKCAPVERRLSVRREADR